jgi:predicted dehydrogenase
VTGLQLSRNDFFEKELRFQVSCSYGPGRYDEDYEKKGLDYPIGFVRWTENRNFQAILNLMAKGRLDLDGMVSHRFSFADVGQAYQVLSEGGSSMGLLLEYPKDPEHIGSLAQDTVTFHKGELGYKSSEPVLSFIGAGNYATRMLMPAFSKAGAQFHRVASRGAVSGVYTSKIFGFREATTNVEKIFNDQEAQVIVVATHHDTHADYVCRALEQGRHVFVEKPLAISFDQLKQVESCYQSLQQSGSPLPHLMVGFNRRFAPQVQTIKKLLKQEEEPKAFVLTVNAGEIPKDHWTQKKHQGGGRIVGEGCHFIDLLRFLSGEPIVDFKVVQMGPYSGVRSDKVSLSLVFADGSLGTIHYLANGAKSFPKERLEVFCNGKTLQLDNFRKMRGFDWSGLSKQNLVRQDKGQSQMAVQFLEAVRTGGEPLIPWTELLEVTQLSLQVAEQLAD